jgi:hypothetical protein
MAVAVLFLLTVLSVGFGVLRVLGISKGAVGLGLAPAVGLALLAVVSSWCALIGAPPPVAGVVTYALALVGLALTIHDCQAVVEAARTLAREQQVAAALLVAALAVPLIAMGFAFAGVEVPLSPHDGAAHTEAIQAYRLGQTWSDWYPPGTAAIFAAWLQVLPWIDSAQGAFDLGMSLPSLSALAVFGLGVAVWRDLRMAATGALLLSFTYLFPFFPQLWSGWPLTISVILVLGMWTVALEYLYRPAARWAVLAGLVLGAVVLVHGSELYTLVILLPIVLLGARRQMNWPDLPRVVGLAMLVALASAAVYLPNLVRWAAAGGAYAVGLQETAVFTSTSTDSATVAAGPGLFATFALDSLGIDLPLRLTLLGVGIGWSIRKRVGRSVVVVGIAFAGIAVALNGFADVALLRQIYSITFPWGMHYRLLMLVTIAQVLLAGAGGVVLLTQVTQWAKRPNPWARRLGRVTRILVVTWLGLMTWGLAVFMRYPASQVLGYSADDAAAMAWLREHATPGEVLANDGYADAGIWAPYKAGLPILLPRSAAMSPEELSRRTLILQNVGRLDQVAEAGAAACAEHVQYVYYGSRASAWDTRGFRRDLLRASPALQDVFSQGGASVFQTRLNCETWASAASNGRTTVTVPELSWWVAGPAVVTPP